MALDAESILKAEKRWSLVAFGAVVLIFAAILFAAMALGRAAPGSVETIEPATLHLSSEFHDGNLGTRVEPDGRIVARIVAAQFAFQPSCVVLPKDTRVTLRLTTPDVIHGILVSGSNVNTMVVPGYVSEVHATLRRTGDLLMPCHEFCGLGHSQMLARVRVVDLADFKPDADGRVHCDSAEVPP